MQSLEDSPRWSSSIRLLLVEDNPRDTRQISEMLGASEDVAIEVTTAVRVEDALRRLQEENFGVVLLDLTLPEGRGLAALARARIAAASVPVVVMTREEDQRMALEALRQGAQDYLVKDKFDSQLLVRTVVHAVERHRMLMELRVARQREHFFATHDNLTGLPNRSSFMDRVRRMVSPPGREGAVVALLYLDLNRFKEINDSLGHAVGDELLRIVGRRLAGAKTPEEFVARVGGDEFVVLSSVAAPESVREIAARLATALSRPYTLAGREYWLSASIGAALFPQDAADAETLIRRADAAMYHAKVTDASEMVLFSSSMDEGSSRRMQLGQRLREALERGEMSVVYQPVRSISSGRVVRAEALLRWRDADSGEVQPKEFISIAENNGMIVPLGEWVLATVCSQAEGWWTKGFLPVPVAVNVSSTQLVQADFADRVAALLAGAGMPASLLELEITESTMMQDDEESRRSLVRLSRMGVRIALDDFGTGYSSLSHLRRLPIDRIKIDRAFVSEATTSTAGAALTAAIIGMAHSLGLAVVAEGVETPEQEAFLVRRGCDEYQGFLFSEPRSADDFERFLVRDAAAPALSAGEDAERGPGVQSVG